MLRIRPPFLILSPKPLVVPISVRGGLVTVITDFFSKEARVDIASAQKYMEKQFSWDRLKRENRFKVTPYSSIYDVLAPYIGSKTATWFYNAINFKSERRYLLEAG